MRKLVVTPVLCFLLIIGATLVQEVVSADVPLTKQIMAFRDDPEFYQVVRGIRRKGMAVLTPKNLDYALSTFDPVYHNYLHELFLGFIAEQQDNLADAETHYLRSLDTLVHEEGSWYGLRDLSRVSLKRRNLKEAKERLESYLGFLVRDIKTAEGEMSPLEYVLLYGPNDETLEGWKRDKLELESVLFQLKAVLEQRR